MKIVVIQLLQRGKIIKIHPLNIKNKKIIILDMKLKIEDNTLLSMIDATINEN